MYFGEFLSLVWSSGRQLAISKPSLPNSAVNMLQCVATTSQWQLLSNNRSTTLIILLIPYSMSIPNFITFGTYSTAVAFATLALINLLRLPFFLLPFTANLLNQYKVTFNRIQEFVLLPEIKTEDKKPKKNTGSFLLQATK